MNKEFLKMQKLAGLITESQFKQLVKKNINEKLSSYQEGDDIFDVIYVDILSPAIEDYSENNSDGNDLDRDNSKDAIGFETDHQTDEQKENYLKYLKKKADEGNEIAQELFRIAKTLPEVKPLLKQLGFTTD